MVQYEFVGVYRSIVVGLLTGLLSGACSSSESTTDGVCSPGESIACTGPGGCSGGQACKADGAGYDDCVCGSDLDGGAEPGATGGQGTGGGTQGKLTSVDHIISLSDLFSRLRRGFRPESRIYS